MFLMRRGIMLDSIVEHQKKEMGRGRGGVYDIPREGVSHV